MKRFFISVLVVFFSVMALNAATENTTVKLTRLGQSPFYGYVKDSETARQFIQVEIGAIKYALNMVYGIEKGNRIFFALCEQVDEAEFRGLEVCPLVRFEWMLFRSGGFQRVIKNVEWAGHDSFKAFAFCVDLCVDYGWYKRYLFVIPQVCGNISLLEIGKIRKTPEQTLRTVLVATELEAPRKIDIPDFLSEQEKPKVEIAKSQITGIFDIGGAMVRKCYGKYLPAVRFGLQYNLDSKDRFSLVATIGASMPLQIKQTNAWQPFFIADLTFRSRIYRFFSLGIGAGYSSSAQGKKVPHYWEGIFNLGVKIKEMTIFFETRLALTELENIGKFPSSKIPHKFVFGIRLPMERR